MEQDGRKKKRPDGFSLSNLRCLVLNHRSDIGCNKLNIKVTSYKLLKNKTINKDYSNHIRLKQKKKHEIEQEMRGIPLYLILRDIRQEVTPVWPSDTSTSIVSP